ncbi:MAG: hypothetical protein KBD10_00780 [Candidatus Pacebacteria bacterium]|nr:hypothetical protein [Candidatus Paceibacterota bacterium]
MFNKIIMIKKGLKINSLIATIFILSISIIPQVSNAEVSREQLSVEFVNDFVLEPAKNEVFLDPNSTATKTISVINRIDKIVTFQIDIEDVVGSENPSEQVKLLGEEKSPYSLKNFLIPEITEFTLNPGEKITIPVKVELPADSEPRGYYGAIIVSAKGAETGLGDEAFVKGVTKLVTRVGSIFLVRVNGDLKESSHLWDFKALGPVKKFYSTHPKGFEVAIKNDGNVHLVHYGEIKIKNIFGRQIANIPLNAFFSLPDSVRYREVNWPASFSFGFYKAEIELYQGFGKDAGFLNSEISFFVIPWTILALLILVSAIIYGLIRLFKNNFKIERKK